MGALKILINIDSYCLYVILINKYKVKKTSSDHIIKYISLFNIVTDIKYKENVPIVSFDAFSISFQRCSKIDMIPYRLYCSMTF